MYKIELKFNNPTTKAISFECNDVELPKTLDKAKRIVEEYEKEKIYLSNVIINDNSFTQVPNLSIVSSMFYNNPCIKAKLIQLLKSSDLIRGVSAIGHDFDTWNASGMMSLYVDTINPEVYKISRDVIKLYNLPDSEAGDDNYTHLCVLVGTPHDGSDYTLVSGEDY